MIKSIIELNDNNMEMVQPPNEQLPVCHLSNKVFMYSSVKRKPNIYN